MTDFQAELLYRPEHAELRFLPEGPQWLDDEHVSWDAIQHGEKEPTGSLNVLHLGQRSNRHFRLPGRPGFAIPTNRTDTYLIGLERKLCLFDPEASECRPWLDIVIDQDVEGTIINDGEAFPEGVVFGTKDLEFANNKAGLYLYRHHDRTIHRLRDDQICSNGKVLLSGVADGAWSLYDIDSPRKTVVRYSLDVQQASLSEGEVVVDLTESGVFPDGMVAAPDGKGLIVALYNPEAAECGEACDYDLQTGKVRHRWRLPGSPQVTCPQIIVYEGKTRLVLTTAVEHMPIERQDDAPNAGGIFWADTPYDEQPTREPFALD